MRTIKLVVAYDGSNYHGFQKQKNVLAVQNAIEEALAKVCGEQVHTAGSGRTDAGVHALAQTMTFETSGRIPCANMIRALGSLLPPDIVAISAEEMEVGFHARFSAKWKRYQYRIIVNKYNNPLEVKYAWQMREQLDVKSMNEASAQLLGTHDFSAFRSSGSVEGTPIRTIYEAGWTENNGELIFDIAGDGFLYHMVRNLVWSLVQIGLGKRTLADFKAELNSQRCAFESSPAPAQGLYLAQVYYKSYPEK